MTDSIPAAIVEPLLAWYDANARVLPWRSQPTPYRVWVSETMLQQTRVEAVRPYFARFMQALPDIAALAAVDEQTLLKLWEGLGYYSRARNLHKAAGVVMQQYGGRLPADPQLLAKLPGIGPYTAGAIASIAFNYPAAAVDGNVLRVLSRLTAFQQDVGPAAVRAATAQALLRILPARVGAFNQALMELGALVCLPNTAPKCLLCPLAALCRGRAVGLETQLPVKAKKKPRAVQQRTVLLALHEGRVALRRRPDEGLLAGLWEFPALEGALTAGQLPARLAALGLHVQGLSDAGSARHIFTHLEWQMHGWYVQCADDSAPADWLWVTPQQLAGRYAVPSAFRAFTAKLGADRPAKEGDGGALSKNEEASCAP